ncbi:MAG TPA: TraR/DksA family transcriptional regulator [Thermoanaerobaculia bacterium]
MSKLYCFEFSALLQAQRRHLLDEVREEIAVSGERLGSANQTKIAEDDAPADAVAEMDLAMVIRESQKLQEIEAAIARIRDGSYGICIDCSGEIGRARLKADPRANRCPACQIRVLPLLPTGER